MFKIITNPKLFGCLMLGLLITQSCSKKSGGADEEPPISKHEVEQRIVGKWELNGTSKLSSIEFTADGLYALEGDLTVLPSVYAATTAGREISKAQHILAEVGSSGYIGSHVGEYTVSANGDVVLDGVMTLTISKLSDATFAFELTGLSNGSSVTGSAVLESTMAAADRTQLLSRRWVAEDEDNPMFSELSVRFTAFGTVFLHMMVYTVDEAVGPDGQVVDVVRSEESVAFRMDWDWKAGTTDDIVELFMVEPESGAIYVEEWPIRKLTQNELEIRAAFDDVPFWLSLRAAN